MEKSSCYSDTISRKYLHLSRSMVISSSQTVCQNKSEQQWWLYHNNKKCLNTLSMVRSCLGLMVSRWKQRTVSIQIVTEPEKCSGRFMDPDTCFVVIVPVNHLVREQACYAISTEALNSCACAFKSLEKVQTKFTCKSFSAFSSESRISNFVSLVYFIWMFQDKPTHHLILNPTHAGFLFFFSLNRTWSPVTLWWSLTAHWRSWTLVWPGQPPPASSWRPTWSPATTAPLRSSSVWATRPMVSGGEQLLDSRRPNREVLSCCPACCMGPSHWDVVLFFSFNSTY